MDRGLKRKGFIVIGALLCAMAMQAHAATITVTNTNDSGPGSLRQALANANNGDRINFGVTGTIALTNVGLEVNKNVMISGPGANQLSIDGKHAIRAVGDNDGGGISNEGTEGNATATIFSTAVSGNSAGGVFTSGSGHGFQSLAITNSTVSGNSTYGGIRASGNSYLSVANSTISGNSAADSGGGIYAGGFDASIVNSTISGNSAGT